MINRGLLIIGIVLALVGFGAAFVVNQIIVRPTDYIIAARIDIPAGTYINELPEDAFIQVPVQFDNASARKMLDGVAQPQDLAAMRTANAVIIQDIYTYQPLVLGAVISSNNPAAFRIARLGLDNPDLMVITIPASGNVPSGLMSGDRIDLAVTVSSVADPLELSEDEPVTSLPFSQTSLGAIPPEALAEILEASGYSITAPEEGSEMDAATSADEDENSRMTKPEEPTLREPVTKLLIRGSLVLNVQYARSVTGITAEGDAQLMRGEITGIDVIIPRETFEFVTMAINSGDLQIGLLSPLVDDTSNEPTLGASLQDFLDLYLSDRTELTAESNMADILE
jgi:hypothetical protein